MTVLDSIIEGVREDLAKRRKSLNQIHEEMTQAAPVLDAHLALTGDEMKVIAEVKRSSPSKGALSAITDPFSRCSKTSSARLSHSSFDRILPRLKYKLLMCVIDVFVYMYPRTRAGSFPYPPT